jgi:hypothetical protein
MMSGDRMNIFFYSCIGIVFSHARIQYHIANCQECFEMTLCARPSYMVMVGDPQRPMGMWRRSSMRPDFAYFRGVCSQVHQKKVRSLGVLSGYLHDLRAQPAAMIFCSDNCGRHLPRR